MGFESIKAYLGACRIFVPVMWIQGCTTFISWVLHDSLGSSYGMVGIAWALNITYFINCAVLWGYIRWSGCVRKSWIPWTSEMFNDLWSYLERTVPLTMIIYCSGFSWFINFLFVGWIQDDMQMAIH